MSDYYKAQKEILEILQQYAQCEVDRVCFWNEKIDATVNPETIETYGNASKTHASRYALLQAIIKDVSNMHE